MFRRCVSLQCSFAARLFFPIIFSDTDAQQRNVSNLAQLFSTQFTKQTNNCSAIRFTTNNKLLNIYSTNRFFFRMSYGCDAKTPENNVSGTVLNSHLQTRPSSQYHNSFFILPSDTLFGDDLYCICFDHPNRETAMLSSHLDLVVKCVLLIFSCRIL